MVCAKCQRLSKATTLATPGVKKKSEIYFGSSASSSSKSGDKKTSATLGQNGIGKSKLLSKSARNPYASYSSSCSSASCTAKIDQGHKYCQKCAYKANACAICGKSSTKSTTAAPIIAGQKFTLK